MGHPGRSNSTARGLEARKLAEVEAVDGERSEAEMYVCSLKPAMVKAHADSNIVDRWRVQCAVVDRCLMQHYHPI